VLHANVSPRQLGLIRIGVFGMWLVQVLFDPIPGLADMPVELLQPAGILALLPASLWHVLWTPAALACLKALLLVGLTAAVIGTPRFRLIALLTCLLLTFYQGLPRSFGFCNHAQIAPLYAAYVLALFPAADGCALFRRARPRQAPVMYQAPMVGVSLVFLLAYSLIGLRRICTGGWDVLCDETILYHIVQRSAAPGGFPIRFGLMLLEYPTLAFLVRAGFPVITLLEVLAPLCLFSTPFRRFCWIPVMLSFHLSTWLLMGIFFPMYIGIILLFLTDLGRWIVPHRGILVRGSRAGSRPFQRRPFGTGSGVVASR
jgi:hypothetical protein